MRVILSAFTDGDGNPVMVNPQQVRTVRPYDRTLRSLSSKKATPPP
jgi:hypothetical protein